MLIERQISKLTQQVSLRMLRQGKIPDALTISKEIAPFVARASGVPTFKPRYQGYRQVWDLKGTNKSLNDIKFDLEIIQDEGLDQYRSLLDRMSLIDLSYQSQRQQLDALNGLLRNLAFVSRNLEDNFYGVFDSFDDLSKVDLSKSTREVVDLNEGCVLLPQTDATADRVDMSHLYSRQSWPITAEVPDERVEDMVKKGLIVQNEPVPGAWFGYAFSDMVNAWRQVVTTSNGLGCTIEFTIPVTGTENQSATITKISLVPASTADSEVSVLHSLDNVNWLKFPGVPETITVKTGRATNLDFESTRVRFLRFRVRIAVPTDRGDVNSFSYVFGFKSISLHKLGRLQQAEFYSQPLSASAMTKAIDKFVLSVVESIPANSGIEYYISAADDVGEPRDGVWRPIQPINRPALDGIPQIIKFGESASKAIYLPSPDPSVVHDTVRGVLLYRLTTEELEHEPLFGQALVFRGENAWWRNSQEERITRQAKDVFVDFNSGDIQKLYVAATEVADLASEVPPLGTSLQTVLSVSNVIDYDPATYHLIPPTTVDAEVDQRPRYAIYKILRFRDRMTISNEVVTLTGTTWTSLSNAGVAAAGTGRPVVKNTAESVTYSEGVDYVLEEDDLGRLTGRIRRVQTSSVTSNISDGASVKVTYELDPDVTFLVDKVVGRKVYLSKDLGQIADQYFQVTYRHIPLPPSNEIQKPTIHVTDQYGSSEGTIFAEGTDFLIDTAKGTITRMPAGQIRGDLCVFIDFRYDQTPRDLDTFTSWFFVERRDPFSIDINPLSLDLEAGEVVLIDGADVSRRTTLPELTFGWHSITVRSKRPESFGDAAIQKISVLTDRNGDAVFVAGGVFFSRMSANRIPLVQKSYTQLAKNTLRTDHSFFAIDEGHVVVNFEPGETDEVYTYGLRFVNQALEAGTWPEEFRLEYTYALSTADPVTKILVKAVLSRGPNSDGGPTPKLHEYHGRIS